ncbi:Ubiquitin-like modifier-activating enzyme ATG7 [Trypanosoma brucei equiperdum]|uniref:Ubiquitin-like modifier-activating enzyme ATG7 n=1 Tax=Trypanosoma brucei equiperdum TaxID=630700 RepID=A0A3L6L0R5_9TRYP|nr:Ubiquitin-like modifier-activating enzyme ATG7 [Trypanosoma brucei equiperdum]
MERLKYLMHDFRIEISFWYELEKRKLHEWRLSEPIIRSPVFGVTSSSSSGIYRSLVSLRAESLSASRVNVTRRLRDETSVSEGDPIDDHSGGTGTSLRCVHTLHDGFIQNFNTAKQLYQLPRRSALWDILKKSLLLPLYTCCKNKCEENVTECPSAEELAWEDVNFSIMALYTYADLKSHCFLYSVAFPVFDLGSPVFVQRRVKGGYTAAGSEFKGVYFPNQFAVDRVHAHLLEKLQKRPENGPNPFIVVRSSAADVKGKGNNDDGCVIFLPFSPKSMEAASNHSMPLIAFLDYSSEGSPGWAVRNIVSALRLAQPLITSFALYCVRNNDVSESVLFHCMCEPLSYTLEEVVEGVSPAKVVGWVDPESDGGAPSVHTIDLGPLMSPDKLADASAGLNLTLMKWRALPELNLDRLAQCKALLLGTGTLGCNVARQLLMWGVRHITLVDRGKVSFSNPVRQTLFELSDVNNPREEERNKAIAAAKALKRILPGVNARGVPLTIHMPGHRVDKVCEEEVKAEIEALDELIRSHDVVFLLTDSREARWLPTLMATAHCKPTVNVALAFDTYVVMRHGLDPPEGSDKGAKYVRLGCYFCSDSVAPRDSITARTLDQQCTVTRPGLSAIASAIAVELLAQLYNHPLGFACPPYVQSERDATPGVSDSVAGGAVCPLGTIPQQIRGSVAHHNVYTLHGCRYEQCTACSDPIVRSYKDEGLAFVLRCINDPMYIEEVSGVKAFKESCALDSCDGWDDDVDNQ